MYNFISAIYFEETPIHFLELIFTHLNFYTVCSATNWNSKWLECEPLPQFQTF